VFLNESGEGFQKKGEKKRENIVVGHRFKTEEDSTSKQPRCIKPAYGNFSC